MAALVEACRSGEVPATVALVVSPRDDNPAFASAQGLGVPVVALSPKSPDYAASLVQALQEADVGYVCLAGLMTKLPLEVLDLWPGRVLNIHPALLPRFGGQGMYGRHVHEAVLASGVALTGCSVHIVTENYDEGPVVLRMECPVLPGDTPETLAARVLELEHRAYPLALKRLVEGHG